MSSESFLRTSMCPSPPESIPAESITLILVPGWDEVNESTSGPISSPIMSDIQVVTTMMSSWPSSIRSSRDSLNLSTPPLMPSWGRMELQEIMFCEGVFVHPDPMESSFLSVASFIIVNAQDPVPCMIVGMSVTFEHSINAPMGPLPIRLLGTCLMEAPGPVSDLFLYSPIPTSSPSRSRSICASVSGCGE